jgi:hypothetical protein
MPGDVPAALAPAEEGVALADRSRDAGQRVINRTAGADALPLSGQVSEAAAGFLEAERWKASGPPRPGGRGPRRARRHVPAVWERATRMVRWVAPAAWLRGCACEHLGLARVARLPWQMTADRHHPWDRHRRHTEIEAHRGAAMDRLRQQHQICDMPRDRLIRAESRACSGDEVGARADLRAAEAIAARRGMRLHLAHLLGQCVRLHADRHHQAARKHLATVAAPAAATPDASGSHTAPLGTTRRLGRRRASVSAPIEAIRMGAHVDCTLGMSDSTFRPRTTDVTRMESRAIAGAILKRPAKHQPPSSHMRRATMAGLRRDHDSTMGSRRLVGVQRGTAPAAMTAGMIDVSSPAAPGAVTPLPYTIVGPEVRGALGSPSHGGGDFPDS